MTLTFGHYTLLMATRHGVTLHQLAEQTNFDPKLIFYLLEELVNHDLLRTSQQANEEQDYYELTDISFSYIQEYERQNPDLIISGSIDSNR
ncbi:MULTISPECIES: hypothetical protein [Spirosoma]|uniref:MarR family transcriptional regulator n=1 Tax=Spirosoma liriopis TaxID=2937440 RepID=A0ABT0HET7_9BACT|nr:MULTISPECIES: hypothetical protein [Spirosoma]MCK8490676.1 hypothetical protein [Spirosoma liriopis]UHG90036.1 hypothetical protein LQ777_17485 [Spirosoma oryzicola]